MRMVLLRVGIAEEVVQLVRPLDTAIDSLQFHKESENLLSDYVFAGDRGMCKEKPIWIRLSRFMEPGHYEGPCSNWIKYTQTKPPPLRNICRSYELFPSLFRPASSVRSNHACLRNRA